MTYDIGDKVTLGATFATAAGVATDPTAVTLRVKPPSAVVTTYTYGDGESIVRDSVGVYHCEVAINAAGTWHYRWAGTGDLEAAEEGSFFVRTQEA